MAYPCSAKAILTAPQARQTSRFCLGSRSISGSPAVLQRPHVGHRTSLRMPCKAVLASRFDDGQVRIHTTLGTMCGRSACFPAAMGLHSAGFPCQLQATNACFRQIASLHPSNPIYLKPCFLLLIQRGSCTQTDSAALLMVCRQRDSFASCHMRSWKGLSPSSSVSCWRRSRGFKSHRHSLHRLMPGQKRPSGSSPREPAGVEKLQAGLGC